MKPEDFEFISALIKQRSGLVLTPDKSYLLESRLMPVARKGGMTGLEDLINSIRTSKDEALIRSVTEAMTTNESFFFRDVKPFDIFRNLVLPHLAKTRAAKRAIRIWCAAASSGQEPYSLSIVLNDEAAKFAGWKTEILGTDLSTDILAKAKNGVYSQFEVQRGLPIQQLLKYFEKKDEMWRVKDIVRSKVEYREYNLLDDFTKLGGFDVVFCRNVLIYFDAETKSKILDRISRLLPPDGMLFLGGAETVLGISDKFKPIPGQRGVYCLTDGTGLPEALPAAS